MMLLMAMMMLLMAMMMSLMGMMMVPTLPTRSGGSG